MLDVSLAVMDSSGNPLAFVATASLDESITIEGLLAGTYYLVVGSAGGYGDVGQYSVHVL
jgi:hypothetical protein